MNGFEMLIEEVAHTFQPIFKQAVDVVLPVYKQVLKQQNDIAASMAMSMRAQRESYDDYQIRKWLSQVPHGGMVGDKAVLILYNEEHPSQSLLIVEDTKNL